MNFAGAARSEPMIEAGLTCTQRKDRGSAGADEEVRLVSIAMAAYVGL